MKALLTTREAAEYLGYSVQAMNTSRGKGKKLGGIDPPKHTNVGDKTVRYKRTDLDKWIEELG
jgi:hypothetical protein